MIGKAVGDQTSPRESVMPGQASVQTGLQRSLSCAYMQRLTSSDVLIVLALSCAHACTYRTQGSHLSMAFAVARGTGEASAFVKVSAV